MVFNRDLFERDVACGCLRRRCEGVFAIKLIGYGAKEADTRVFTHVELGTRLDHLHVGDDGVGDGGNVGDAFTVCSDAGPKAARRIRGIALRSEHGAREHERIPPRVTGVCSVRAQIDIAEDEVVGVDRIGETGIHPALESIIALTVFPLGEIQGPLSAKKRVLND